MSTLASRSVWWGSTSADRVTWICVVLSILAGLFPRAARAQSDSDRATARSLAREGFEAQKRGQYDTAADRFQRAEALVHAPTLLLGLARAQVGLGKLVEAHETYERIAREPLAPGSPAPFAKAVDDAKREAPALTARLAWVTIGIQGPSTADIVMDGVPIPSAELGVKRACDPGQHLVKASSTGYSHAERTFSVTEGGSATVTLALLPEVEPPPPVPEHPAPVEVTHNDSSSSAQKPIGIAVLGLGVAGLVLGGVTGVLALTKHASLDSACGGSNCKPSESGEVSTYRTLANVSTVATIVGAAGAVAGVALLVTAPQSPTVTAYAGVLRVGIMGTF
jgi:hypothetical protein